MAIPLRREQAPAPPNELTRYIPLTQGRFALVDNTDYEFLSQWAWRAQRTTQPDLWYAVRSIPSAGRWKQTMQLMHRLILQAPPEIAVDHRDRNGLNNTRANIRLATDQQNQANRGPSKLNTSGYKGVSASRGRWMAMIEVDGRSVFLGRFINKLDAAVAYEKAAIRLHGSYAKTLLVR